MLTFQNEAFLRHASQESFLFAFGSSILNLWVKHNEECEILEKSRILELLTLFRQLGWILPFEIAFYPFFDRFKQI